MRIWLLRHSYRPNSTPNAPDVTIIIMKSLHTYEAGCAMVGLLFPTAQNTFGPMSAPTSKLDAQFNRTHISQRDFEEAADYLNADDPSQSDTVRRALLLAAIVAYARPFTKNEDSSRAS